MTRATIDFGIDLGTSNSSVAVFSGERVEIIRNNENNEITPSVVRYLPNGTVQVGQAAYQHLRMTDAGGSTFARFKRSMGQQEPYLVESTGAEVTPEILAAEVLKSIRQDAEAWEGKAIERAVITVPAMFDLTQCEATTRAAAMASIRQAPLLQEPIAAGLAYGYDNNADDGYFLVYDIGSGTLDVSILRIEAGRLSVVGTEGDNYLGGSDWDLLLSRLISERLEDQGYSLWGVDDPDGYEFRARLKFIAEQEKIQLSRREQVELFLDGTMSDSDGRAIATSMTIQRSEFEPLIESDLDRSIEAVTRLIETRGMSNSAFKRLILVGGPTKTPYLRTKLSSVLGIPLETRLDPMTVVVNGAARFASTIPIEDKQIVTQVSIDTLELSLIYPHASEETVVPVGGRFEDAPAGLVIEVRRADGGWKSGRIPVQGGIFQTSVPLVQGRGNVFGLTASGAQGQHFHLNPEKFTITQGLVAAPPPLSRTISIVAFDATGKPAPFAQLVRDTPLPCVSLTYQYSTVREVRAHHGEDVLAIHVVEGEHDRPELNRHVGNVMISGALLTRDLPKGSPIEIKLRVDQSRNIQVSAYIPLFDQTITEVLQNKFLQQDDPELIRKRLDNELDRISQVSSYEADGLDQISKLAQQIQNDLSAAIGGEADRAHRAASNWKELSAAIDSYENAVAVQHTTTMLQSWLGWTQQIVSDRGDTVQRERLRLLRIESEEALDKRNVVAMQTARDDLRDLYFEIRTTESDFWVSAFSNISQKLAMENVSPHATLLLQQGRNALLRSDISQLRKVCYALWDLMPDEDAAGDTLQDIGIRIN